MAILVTGGAGYIGTHTCIELLAAGFEVVVVDNLCNSKYEAVRRVESVSGKAVAFHELDVNDRSALAEVFKEHKIDAVIHFAGLKAVGESTQKPLLYYHNNVGGSVAVSEVMLQYGVSCILFSSTATVYGEPESSPIPETFPTCPEHPYGRSKLMVEELLRDCCKSPDSPWRVGLLRYFNPIGAHHSGMLGEDPQGIPNNLLPYVSQVAIGKLEKLRVFGGDYPTVDGTGVRDYIHVVDLARGHVKALQKLLASSPCCLTYNLGTGRGVSVLQIVKAFEKACGKPIPYEVVARRPGDLAEYFGDPSLAREELGWTAEFGIERMVEDTWRWQSANPRGYDD